ncbi:MAG: hypothetical protein KDI15_01825 [Thiothrix sp.]|nr:hypothetical protein [Thiothrix sp.]HPE59981.1 hypothetical protein [Thiolinea sp.]
MPQCLRPLLRLLSLLMLSALLAACSGFQLRQPGSVTETPLQGLAVFIDPARMPDPAFIVPLEVALRDDGAHLLSKAAAGAVIIGVDRLEQDKTVSGYSALRQVKEFNHYIEVTFHASRKVGDAEPERVEDRVRAERTQLYDSRYVLGVAEEERSIRRALREEVARLLVLRLRRLMNRSPPAGLPAPAGS